MKLLLVEAMAGLPKLNDPIKPRSLPAALLPIGLLLGDLRAMASIERRMADFSEAFARQEGEPSVVLSST